MVAIDKSRRKVEIEICKWELTRYGTDISTDIFDAGMLEFDANEEAYIVDDCEYLVECANDWKKGIGDYSMEGSHEDFEIFVEWVRR